MFKHILLLSSLALLISQQSLSASPLPAGEGLGERSASPLYSILGRDTTCNIFLYSPGASSGLHVAYLTDKEQWQDMGMLCGSGYAGDSGRQGTMLNPYVCHAADGSWRLLFAVGGTASCFAAAYSEDLLTWRPQDFPQLRERGISEPVMFQMDDGSFDIYCKAGDGTHRYVKADKDFRRFSEDSVASSISADAWIMDTATVAGHCYDGNMYEVPKVHLDYIMHYFAALADDARLSAESMKDDARRFASLGSSADATLAIDMSKAKRISGKMNGMDIGDINRMADGGLYAELLSGGGCKAFVTRHDTLFDNGWGGIAAEPQQQVDFSVSLLVSNGKKSQALVALVDGNGEEYAKAKIKLDGTGWQHFAFPLTIEDKRKDNASPMPRLRFMLTGLKDDSIEVSGMSLFPHDTFRGHSMKKDIGEAVAAMRPGYIRIDGKTATEKHWATLYDYLQFCKDIGAEPVLEFAADANANDVLSVLAKACSDTMPAMPKYLIIGSGASVNTPYEQHFTALATAVKSKYPDISIAVSTGAAHFPSPDYTEGHRFAKANNRTTGMVSESYNATLGWLLHHQDYYETYDRREAKVVISEWNTLGSTMEDALAEALYLCSVERNGDVVELAACPRNAVEAGTPCHSIQNLFSRHCGNTYISSTLAPSSLLEDSASAACRLSSSVVADASGKTYVKLVNALPSSLTVSITGMQIPDGTAAIGFSGNPGDTKAQDVKVAVNGQKVSLPPYSVVVMER